ncbi:type IV secretory system conjugative DNA transfer family protein [Leucobacter sp. UCMA 4100]|uniref:type IV secretory system conjugative DNA transfer family protein n=1 Tax=Leucobacter sp. UCMA 4100 TaxID=2810534 RepID=UPI0022EAB098|nr:type IV secretory system conjugative DNA transfer family protein [Leucobacter sp. UCMA 4100]MDA3146510.1 type IV secretory system conjugative DNA transfer family protein [Leucobacter sp. UCMA 4100]
MKPKYTWSTLPAGLAFAGVIAAVIGLVMVPQLFAIAVTNPSLFRAEDKPALIALVKLWGTSTPTQVTGGRSDAAHWAAVLGLIVGFVGGVIFLMVLHFKRKKNPQLTEGLAKPSQARKQLGEKKLLEAGARFRPSLDPALMKASHVGYRLGEFQGVEIWLKIEDPIIVIGPSRSGKGWHIVLNWLLDAPGAVITTSSKMDNATMTIEERQRGGRRVWVFAPGVIGGESLGHVLRWNPIEGCEDEETLIRRIKALIPSDSFSGSTSNGGHWDTLGQQLAAHLFHAAALGNKTVDDVWEWVSNPQEAMNAVKLIREHERGLSEHAAHLEQIITQPPEQRVTSWGTLSTVLAFLESGSARAWMKPGKNDEQFDPVRFVFEKETLYLVGDKQTTGGYVRIIDGLLAEMDFVTKGIADAMPGTRLDPPVTYLLDEAGNFEYQGLYELITAGGGRGRVGVVVFQSKGQLAQWGAENAETLWDAAAAKIILPGGSKSDDLRDMEQLIGDMWVQRDSHSWGKGQNSVSVSREKQAILTGKQIRELENRYCLLFYKNLPAVIPEMRPFNEHRRFKDCQANASRLSQQIAATSQFAEQIKEYSNA